ncbi:hypothetical protein [Streptomyces sp. SAI-229]|jgi:ATP-dependent DNA helicase RecQ|uniref:hypothetical protein n=1 Tax=Streptomyces sp. SAI-229 TaxID=3377731 RepID=UPI003C7E26F6
MAGVHAVSAAARQVADLTRGFPEGLTEQDLALRATRRFRGIPRRRPAELITEALGGGLLILSEGRLRHAASPETHAPQQTLPEGMSENGERPEGGALLAVTLDVESVVRTTATAPYAERHVYRAAAVRFGANAEWARAGSHWQRYIGFPGDSDELRDAAMRDAVVEQGVPAEQAWAELCAFLEDADVVVACDGTEFGFPVIGEAAERAGIRDPLAGVRTVDALDGHGSGRGTGAGHFVHGFLRRLPADCRPTDAQRAAYREHCRRVGKADGWELPHGYTFVTAHSRRR